MAEKKVHSLKWQIVGILLLCWLIPVVLVLSVMGWYVADSLSQRAIQSLDNQFALNLQMCADRLRGAVTASRTASTDPTVKNAWTLYRSEGYYLNLYRSARTFLDRQYRTDGRFDFAILAFSDDPQAHQLEVYNQGLGIRYEQVRALWDRDGEALLSLSKDLGTAVGFLSSGGQVYLVRNIMDPGFRPIGVLILSLNTPHFFGSLTDLPWASSITATLGGIPLQLKGQEPMVKSGGYGGTTVHWDEPGDDFTLSARARVDYGVLLSQISGYRYVLAGMALLLLPLLLAALHFFNTRISRPIQAMMEGAKEIEAGKLGHQLSYAANSREFQYLTESFNHMSGRLRRQFDHIYQEELALRDARIKALQSHINPHFLNNTLEIINWEARMNGDAKVSKMIEALSTVLDAAIARDKRPEITLGEEMGYVNAYLYIIGERFGKRITIEKEVAPNTVDRLVPRLILQPVIENAVEHGVGPGGQGVITIRSFLDGETLILEIINDGSLSGEDLGHIDRLLGPQGDARSESAGNIGIANVDARLRILCGPGSGLSIRDTGEGRVAARLTISPKASS